MRSGIWYIMRGMCDMGYVVYVVRDIDVIYMKWCRIAGHSEPGGGSLELLPC